MSAAPTAGSGAAAPASTQGRRLKIVLYNPQAVFFTMPLALLAIGSELDPELYEVVTIDGRLDPDAENTVLSHIDSALCLGVTVLTGAPISDALLISRAAKRARPDLPVVWGGWHPSMFARECLLEHCVDVSVRGQGEETFAEIVRRLAEGRTLEGCAGCTVRLADGTIQENPARPLASVDKFRAHDYGLIPVERYFKLKGKRQLDFISSQGCNFRCAFCSDPFVYGRKWVGLEPTRMALRLKELWDRYHFDDVNFQDETFFTQRDRVQALADRIVESGMKITWAATMRADQGVRMPEEVWARCKESGLRRLLVGVESGSNEMLKRIRKDIKIEQVFHTANLMRKHEIAGHFPFIVGFPDESDASIQATLDCAKKLRSMSPDFLTPIFYFKPYPGSELVIEAVARGFRLPQTLEAWAQFDYVAGEPGPWVSPEKFKLIERFKFFHELAWKPASPAKKILQQLARYRCTQDEYRWPVEMLLSRWIVPAQRLS
jgi:anaerobic magnesium-protoporphyrin IX monomethyl ester cyclase